MSNKDHAICAARILVANRYLTESAAIEYTVENDLWERLINALNGVDEPCSCELAFNDEAEANEKLRVRIKELEHNE